MNYSQRFMALIDEDTEEFKLEPSYCIKADAQIIANRLGLYEDLGFSPAELSEILLSTDSITQDQKDLIRLALLRIRNFDKKGYYLKAPFCL